jgi:hypothetical protein
LVATVGFGAFETTAEGMESTRTTDASDVDEGAGGFSLESAELGTNPSDVTLVSASDNLGPATMSA